MLTNPHVYSDVQHFLWLWMCTFTNRSHQQFMKAVAAGNNKAPNAAMPTGRVSVSDGQDVDQFCPLERLLGTLLGIAGSS